MLDFPLYGILFCLLWLYFTVCWSDASISGACIHSHAHTGCESQAMPVCVVIRVPLLLRTGSVCKSSRAEQGRALTVHSSVSQNNKANVCLTAILLTFTASLLSSAPPIHTHTRSVTKCHCLYLYLFGAPKTHICTCTLIKNQSGCGLKLKYLFICLFVS